MKYDYLIVGAGLFGAVFAREMTDAGRKCLCIDRRDHIGGNIYTEEIEGIKVHRYGAHIFHTSDKEIWDYIRRFGDFNSFINSPLAIYKDELYNLPFNMNTFSRMWGIRTPKEARDIIERQIKESGIAAPTNLEEQAIYLAGTDVYEKLIKGYTQKQWGRECRQLPPFIIKRVPLRFTYNNNYFDDKFQGIPIDGYTSVVERLLEGIEVILGTDFREFMKSVREKPDFGFDKILYTGMIDEYFDYSLGKLQYRSLEFESKLINTADYQGNAVVNYTDAEVPYTRIIEHKHFNPERNIYDIPVTIITREYPVSWKEGMEPYYPVNDERNNNLYTEYIKMAEEETHVIFGGRLGSYKYLDMDKVIREALNLVEREKNPVVEMTQNNTNPNTNLSTRLVHIYRDNVNSVGNQHINLVPMDTLMGYDIRPGFYEINGATAIPGGVNFTIHSNQATSCELLLFHRKEKEPFAVFPFPEHYRIGNCYSMIIFGIDINNLEYAYRMDGPYDPSRGLLFDKNNILLDPYAKAVAGLREWGMDATEIKDYNGYRARVVKDDFDWENVTQPLTPMEDLVIYELHVRGFSKSDSSFTMYPGTFDAIREKVPYLKELGITAVELMPIFEFDEMHDHREYEGNQLIDYWGYNTVNYFSPNTAYCSRPEYNREGNELKRLVKLLNENGIEVFLDVVFNHTAEGNEQGPIFSFKGIDNNIYYMLTPEGYYYNFSGCGNTMNCNHPIVRQMILDCLRYWVVAYRIDGFRFDLATILGRNEDGSPMSKPPLLESLAFDPILGKVKLIAEAWDAGGMYQVGSFPSWNRWVEWNGKYRDDVRSFLKGDVGMEQAAANRISGSPDIYSPDTRGHLASVNFITCHDGFTLHDLYTYNYKHNEANGWNNTDGTNDNYSWNCGIEGETEDSEVNRLRRRLVKNACVTLMLSRGIPMFLAGDEFGNTQFGNNNAYCQDNEISWLDWTLLDKNRDLFNFFQYVIWYRLNHRVIRLDTEKCSLNYPCISQHGLNPFWTDFGGNHHYVGIMFAGKHHETGEDEIIYLAVNAYWEPQRIVIPQAPEGYKFYLMIDTMREESVVQDRIPVVESIEIGPRSVMVMEVFRNLE